MRYFKNVELAKLHGVSEGTVRRWIRAAQEGKLELQLYNQDEKVRIANTARNTRTIEGLVVKGKKFNNTRWHRVIYPTEKFYKLYTARQIADVITSLEVHKEAPLQYMYFGEGAKWWDRYAQRLWDEPGENMLTSASKLLEANFSNIKRVLEGYSQVNITDLCVGNALPVNELLSRLTKEQMLGQYTAIDLSPDMLRLARHNIKKWFGEHVSTQGCLRDLTYERFDDLLVKRNSETTANLITFLGGTMQNFRSEDASLKAIYNSMGSDDLFVTTTKLDTPESRRYFDILVGSSLPKLLLGLEHEVELFGIDASLYDVEEGYDKNRRMRYGRIRFRMDTTIKFKVESYERAVHIPRGDSILLWRYWHHTAQEYLNLLERNGFTLLGASLTNDQQFILTISKIKQSQEVT